MTPVRQDSFNRSYLQDSIFFIRQGMILATLIVFLAACSAGDAEGEASQPDNGEAASVEHAVASTPNDEMEAASDSVQFSDAEIARLQTFDDDRLVALAEANIACDVLTAEDLVEVFDIEFSEGRFRWLESELRRAPAALQGICTFYATSLPRSTSPRSLFLRIYDSSPLVWELNRRDDEDYTRRFHHRPMEAAPEIAERAYRRPQGADSFDATCADLGEQIACLWAHFELTEGWTEKDVEIMSRLADRLAALD